MLALTMDEQTLNRKERLRALVQAEPYAGNQTAFATAAGLTKGRITQMLDPLESFGEISARRLASRLRLNYRYFEDVPSVRLAGVNVGNVLLHREVPLTAPEVVNAKSSNAILQIPTDMPFSNYNLTSTFRLIGRIIEALPSERRTLLTSSFIDLIAHPEASALIAEQAVRTLGIPSTISRNDDLNRWLAGNMETSVETRPADLR